MRLAGKTKLGSNSFSAADRKERTPYRLTRNKTNVYLGDSNDSGYLTSSNGGAQRNRADLTMLDVNYPVDYGGHYRSGRHYDKSPGDYDAALMAGGAAGYPSTSSRYGRAGDYASSYKPRSGLDYSNYYDGSRVTERDNYKNRYDTSENISGAVSGASRRPRTYGPNKTSQNLTAATDGAESQNDSERSRYEKREDQRSGRTGRFCNRTSGLNKDQTSTVPRLPLEPPVFDAEEQELLADDRSSADNAAILALLREDSQYLEAKKFEERMRKRKELKERISKYNNQQEEAKKQKAEAKAKNDKTTFETNKKLSEVVAASGELTTAATKSDSKSETDANENFKPKKVTSPCESVSSESSSGTSTSSQSSTETKPITITAKPTITDTTSKTTNVKTASTSNAPISLNTSCNLHSDRNNNDISKYTTKTSSGGGVGGSLMHSASSGALAFGGIGDRLAAGRNTRYQPQAPMPSRTAAVLSEFEAAGSSASAMSSSRYQHQNNLLNNAYKSSLYDSYSPYGSGGSNRRPGAGAAGISSAAAYQRKQMQAYQQQEQKNMYSSSMLSKSATSAALFNRSRIPKTLSTFVSLLLCVLISNCSER